MNSQWRGVMGDKQKTHYILILFILVLVIIILTLALFLTPSAKAQEEQNGIEVSFYSVPPEDIVLPEGMTPEDYAEAYTPSRIPITGTFFNMDYDKVAAISIEQIIYKLPGIYAAPIKQILMEYTVEKGEKEFDELFDYLNSFRYRGMEEGVALREGQRSSNEYCLPFGLRIIPEPGCGEYVRQYPFYPNEIRSGDFWYIAEDENFFQKLYDKIQEKGTIIGAYDNPFVDWE